MDTVGNKEARREIAMIKIAAPNMACQVVDWAIQAFGGGRHQQRLRARRDVCDGAAARGSRTGPTKCTATSSAGPSCGGTPTRSNRAPPTVVRGRDDRPIDPRTSETRRITRMNQEPQESPDGASHDGLAAVAVIIMTVLLITLIVTQII